ncbi:MAG: SpoIIE family protein phosphatase [Synergistaceae bacterium]|nr:SpoIIE family protein phosphatase [Synergistaceae bacterium]
MRIRTNLAVQILAGVVAILAALCGIVSVIGYYAFTDALEGQYESKSLNTARTAATYVTPAFLSSMDILSAEWRERHDLVRKEWQRLADTQDATFIYLYKKLGEEYERFQVVLSVMRTGDLYTVFSAGRVLHDMPEVYRPAYRSIYEGGADHASVAVYRREYGSEDYRSGDHITVLLPIRDYANNVIAVLGVERRMREIQKVRETYLRHVAWVSIAFLLITLLVCGTLLNRHLLTPIHRIAGEALRFARENTQPPIPLSASVPSANEIGQLARTIDQMEADIRDYIENLTRVTKEKEQIRTELNVAREIQADMLPRTFPPFPDRKEFDIYASMTPAKEVGGDFYDFFFIDRDHLALVMADVSGKGVPAALFMVVAKALIKNRALMGGSPGEILSSVNEQLCDGNETGLFVTVWLGVLELSTGELISANAGHEYPAVKRVGGAWELVKTKHSPAVATWGGMKFRESWLELRPGDSLYLYTDGVPEATRLRGAEKGTEELYGTARMLEALNRHAEEPVDTLLASMKREVDAFAGNAPQFDDVTMLGLRYLGPVGSREGSLTLAARTENLNQVLAFIDGHLESHGCPLRVQRQIEIAAEEIFVNIANYAYAPGTGSATIRMRVENGAAVLSFTDSGIPYNPLAKADPDLTLPASERPVGGLGVYMVKKSMDSVAYERREGQNILTMRKTL